MQDLKATYKDQVSFYNLFWVFVITGVLGYVIETVFCVVVYGVLESRKGLLYGPFSQVYAFGAVLAVLLLTPLTKKKDRWLFLGGALLGGGFEYICSFLQENIFKTVSWAYQKKTISINGRTSLLYMVFWGLLFLVFMKYLCPALYNLIARIPRRKGILCAYAIALFLCVNMVISAAAVYRWAERVLGEAPNNAVEAFLDEQYPDDRLTGIYPNMIVITPKRP